MSHLAGVFLSQTSLLCSEPLVLSSRQEGRIALEVVCFLSQAFGPTAVVGFIWEAGSMGDTGGGPHRGGQPRWAFYLAFLMPLKLEGRWPCLGCFSLHSSSASLFSINPHRRPNGEPSSCG